MPSIVSVVSVEVLFEEVEECVLGYGANEHDVRDFVNGLVLSACVDRLGANELVQFGGVLGDLGDHNHHEEDDRHLAHQRLDHRPKAYYRNGGHDEVEGVEEGEVLLLPVSLVVAEVLHHLNVGGEPDHK
eukprot:CAMPEP_0202978980 /NCGR_PEP_ID=MMETSP1396-20130829/85255_1 /ASSEMBLY_ACC=CAM_ASM_000872 /TAXON_ID= /ORGANISM="Pseudokeronopsis sp., Strain Brazil" /LENGTH=129 /DNA_ID=CAMNT_0049718199 /DNA_START=2660 /DNA_END=3049 /DNA_ORIENTATION=+